MAESLVRRARRAVRPPCGVLSQLQALNLGEVWQNVAAPVLVIRGSKDTVMSRADSSAIAETVNRVHPGKARYLEMEGMTHGFTVEKKFQGEMVTVILNWAKEQVAKEAASSRAGEMGRLKTQIPRRFYPLQFLSSRLSTARSICSCFLVKVTIRPSLKPLLGSRRYTRYNPSNSLSAS